MALGPKPPTYREPIQNASWGYRFLCMVFNFVNHPSLLEETPTSELWNCQPSSKLDPDLGISIEHMSKTILVTDPAYPELFQKTGLDGLPNLHHVTFAIATRITVREEGRALEILLTAKAYDSESHVLPDSGGDSPDLLGHWGPGLRFIMDVGGWAPSPADQLLPIVKDIFVDWKCIVEYLKSYVNRDDDEPPLRHPLIHMDVLGEGLDFRRTTLRIAGTMAFGIGIRNGVPAQIFDDNRRWQELRIGRWEDL